MNGSWRGAALPPYGGAGLDCDAGNSTGVSGVSAMQLLMVGAGEPKLASVGSSAGVRAIGLRGDCGCIAEARPSGVGLEKAKSGGEDGEPRGGGWAPKTGGPPPGAPGDLGDRGGQTDISAGSIYNDA